MFLSSTVLLKIIVFNNSFRNNRQSVKQFGSRSDDLVPNCLERFSAGDNSRQRVIVTMVFGKINCL